MAALYAMRAELAGYLDNIDELLPHLTEDEVERLVDLLGAHRVRLR